MTYKPTRRALAAAFASLSVSTAFAAPTIEEVVVTAQKRTESVQDVSIAIKAFNEEELGNLGAGSLEELTEFVSGAELFDDRGAGQPTWVIRGVGLADFNSNNTPTAAIYYDEFYLTSNVLGGIGMFDIGRVEVLKGPQGGLYGRNTSGGAVRVLSTRPVVGDDFNGYVTGSYGRWDRAGLEGAIGGPITETTAFRIAAATDQGGGWQDSLATPGDDEHGDRDFTAIRAQFAYESSEAFDLLLKLEGGEDKSETTLGYARALYDPNTGDYCAAAYAGRHDENNCVTLSNLTNAFVLTPGDPGILPSGQREDGTKVLSNPINELDNSWEGANLQMNWNMEFATLTSITGYLSYENNQVFDYDAQPLVLFHEDPGESDLTLWSQELRLLSNSDGPLTWLAGAMYAEDEVEEDRAGFLTENFLVLPTETERGFTQTTESWAVYGQLEYDIGDAWKVHGSLRYTDEEKELEDAFHYDILSDFFYVQNVNKSTELDDNWSGHVGVDWAVSDDAMIYARVTQGFKSGGFFGGFPFTEDDLDPYGEETVLSYEAGFKSTWLENTLQLNGALYFYDYQDVQGFTQVFSETTNTVVTKLDNLGDAEHTGAELDMVWLPLEGLSLQATLAWLDAEITDSDTLALDQAGEVFPIEGLKRSYAPEWSTSVQARYEWNVGSSLLAAVQFNYSWRDDLNNEDSELSNINLAAFSFDDYQVLNGRISIGSVEQTWDVALVGKNLTDEEYWSQATGDDLASFNSLPTRPMSYAVEATYRW
ncbi:MAG: TonB-dependent receptor [Halioglobus sp.]